MFGVKREKEKRGGLLGAFFEEDPWEKKVSSLREEPLEPKGQEANEEPGQTASRRVLIQGAPPRPGKEEKEAELSSREEKRVFRLPQEPQPPIEDGKTVLLVLQSILCCILLTVLLVARQGAPEGFARAGMELRSMLEGESLLGRLENWEPGQQFFTLGKEKLFSFLKQEETGKPPAEGSPPEEETAEESFAPRLGEDTLDPEEREMAFDWEEAGFLLEEIPQGQGGEQSVQVAMVKDTASYEAPGWASFSPAVFSRKLILPVEGTVTSPYGYRTHPITDKLDFHTGVDLAAAQGTEIRAALSGQVTEAGTDEIYGNYLILTHGNLTTKYAHCSEIIAPLGAYVRQGERIALVGNTGLSTGPHLHFEVCVDEVTVNPAWALPQLGHSEAGETE